MPKTKNKPGIHLLTTKKYRERKIKGTNIHSKSVAYTEYFWHIVSRNGRINARSSETYTRKSAAVKSMLIAAGAFHGFVVSYYDHSKPDSPLQSYL